MKQLKQLKTLMSGVTLSVVMIASSAAAAYAAPATPATPPSAKKTLVSGPQSKPPIKPGSKDAKTSASLGATAQVKTNAAGVPETSTKNVAKLGNVSGVDFSSFYNYCWKNLTYTTVYNSTSSVKYIHVMFYNQGAYRDVYTSVAAGGSYTYPAFYGVDGSYSAYLYVWNGSSYVYDEYKGGTNTCNVSVSRVYNTGGWVELKIQNLGTAYATQVSSELAPYPGSGTYTGTQYDYPTAGGAAIYRWFNVGTQPYAINSFTYGSFNWPYNFTGDL